MYILPRRINATLAVVPAVLGNPVTVFGHFSVTIMLKSIVWNVFPTHTCMSLSCTLPHQLATKFYEFEFSISVIYYYEKINQLTIMYVT